MGSVAVWPSQGAASGTASSTVAVLRSAGRGTVAVPRRYRIAVDRAVDTPEKSIGTPARSTNARGDRACLGWEKQSYL